LTVHRQPAHQSHGEGHTVPMVGWSGGRPLRFFHGATVCACVCYTAGVDLRLRVCARLCCTSSLIACVHI
jgi:hypothetical protein